MVVILRLIDICPRHCKASAHPSAQAAPESVPRGLSFVGAGVCGTFPEGQQDLWLSFLLLSLPVCFLRPGKYLLQVRPGAALAKAVVLGGDVQTGGVSKVAL